MKPAAEILSGSFGTLPDLIRAHAAEQPDKVAVAEAGRDISYADFDRTIDAVAAALQRDGVAQRQAVAICAAPSIEYCCAFLGALRAGAVPTPLAPSSSGPQLAAMIRDCGASVLFLDAEVARTLGDVPDGIECVQLYPREGGDPDWAPAFAGAQEWQGWLSDTQPTLVEIRPEDPFNIIYSSGTTGTPKGIVQSHAMRWSHIAANAAAGFGDAVTMIATPLYSNTTLVSFLPTLGWGGTVVLTGKKFNARRYLELAEKYRGTHTMLVPVQYQRLMAVEDFDRFDLSSFRLKTCTSAPFSAALKADVVKRWPGMLVEYYGMTEGGASCGLNCTAFPDKLHTVGQPLPGHTIKLIDDDGNEVAPGEMGEVVGRSGAMMNGYHGRQEATRDAEWFDEEGNRYIRHGDVARFDEDGFLILMDRKKDLIISGGFNVYPSDLEAVLRQHPGVADCAVIGVPSEQWGETPVGFYVARDDTATADILAATNAQLGKTQRLSALHPIDELPRSAIGKVLKRELRDRLMETA
jgi:acyl-CoA synthetase (AMP-forming)/AMP-acid ligase II